MIVFIHSRHGHCKNIDHHNYDHRHNHHVMIHDDHEIYLDQIVSDGDAATEPALLCGPPPPSTPQVIFIIIIIIIIIIIVFVTMLMMMMIIIRLSSSCR